MNHTATTYNQSISVNQTSEISEQKKFVTVIKTLSALITLLGWIAIVLQSNAVPNTPAIATGVVCFILTYLRILSQSRVQEFKVNY